jgi:hypothetical protein
VPLEKLDLEYQFTQCSLQQDTKNPDEWFAELDPSRLQLKLDHNVGNDDEEMITQIIYNCLPPGYQTTVELLKCDLNRRVPVTLFEVQEDIRQNYGQIQQQQHFVQQEQHFGRHQHSETRNTFHQHDSLLATFPKNTKSMCRIWGKMGHKATDCWDNPHNKDKPRNSRFQTRNDQPRPQHRSNLKSQSQPSTNQASAHPTTTGKSTCTY